ncbi:MAG: DUF3788 domain-containing protein [Tannerellaceae bacterium]|jgi:hypothetical protein|nr:DUF3788 domain-containing protein [Tannerellaceae bacterium]
MQSIFTDKQLNPTDEALEAVLGTSYAYWQELKKYVLFLYPKAAEEWSYTKSGGWSFRMKDKKRAIIYLIPQDRYFKAALVFGQKATNEVMASPVAAEIKSELESAKVYAEGRGIRIEVRDEKMAEDIKILVDIKVRN